MDHLHDQGVPARTQVRRRQPARSGAGAGLLTVTVTLARMIVTSRGGGGRSGARVRVLPRSPVGGDPGPDLGQEGAKHLGGPEADLVKEGALDPAAETGDVQDLE